MSGSNISWTVDEYGRIVPTVNVFGSSARVQAPLNQANPNTTYVSPNTPQPTVTQTGTSSLAGGYVAQDGSYVPAQAIPGVIPNSNQPALVASTTSAPVTMQIPVAGQPGTQSGPPVHATYNMPPAPDTKTAAQTYRLQHGLATSDDTDALNAESLAAAKAGRTYFNPTLAAQYGQPLPAGVSGPRTDVVNALTLPPSATRSVATAQPTALSAAPSAQTQSQSYPMIYTRSQGVPTELATAATPATTMPRVTTDLLDPNVRDNLLLWPSLWKRDLLR